jgi:hypothetical protein
MWIAAEVIEKRLQSARRARLRGLIADELSRDVRFSSVFGEV